MSEIICSYKNTILITEQKKMFPFKTSQQFVWMIEIYATGVQVCVYHVSSITHKDVCHLPFLPCLIFSSKEGIPLSNNHTLISETLM